MKPWILAGGCLLALAAAQASAQQIAPQPSPLQSSQGRWAASDKCIKDATAQFPDLDQASLHKRDLYVDDCLKRHHLPPRAHLAPDTP